MGTITANIDEETEREFIKKAGTIYGKDRYHLDKAMTEAMRAWVHERGNTYMCILKLFYLSAVILLPSIVLTFLIISASFFGAGMFSGLIYWLILLFVIIFQVIFLIKFRQFIRERAIDWKRGKHHVMFFLFMVLLLAPTLFALPITVCDIIDAIYKTINMEEFGADLSGGGAIQISILAVTTEFLRTYVIINLTLLSIFAGFFIGTLRTDKLPDYILESTAFGIVLAIISILIFFVVWKVLVSFFGAMIV